MPPKKRTGPSASGGRPAGNRHSGGAGATVLAFVLGAGVAAGAAYLYLHSTPHVPSPVPAPTTTHERPPTPVPTPPPPRARTPPFGTSEDVFEGGAHLYAAHCASCHGTPNKNAAGSPSAQQLWRDARHPTAAQSPSDLYNQISAGAPAKGMPAFEHTLTDTQIWQLALLLKNADQDLPDPVVNILNTPPKR